MTKILLVEDDKSLREIYGVRLLAEGYDVVSASDGEQALAMAIKERPALIITDVMMPKISGFDMLDILRSTTETKDIKVIVMTALGSDENKDRGERLGADRYLVKSQVGIEDVVRAVHELLADAASQGGPAVASSPAASMPPAAPSPGITAAPLGVRSAPPTPVPSRAPAPTPAPTVPQPPVAPPVSPPRPPQPPAPNRGGMVSSPGLPAPGMPANAAVPAAQSTQSPSRTAAEPPSRRARIIQPISKPDDQKVDIQALYEKELAKEGKQPDSTDDTHLPTADEERQVVDNQLNNFVNQSAPTDTTADAAVQNGDAAMASATDTTEEQTTQPSNPGPSQLPPVNQATAAPPSQPADSSTPPVPPQPPTPPTTPTFQ